MDKPPEYALAYASARLHAEGGAHARVAALLRALAGVQVVDVRGIGPEPLPGTRDRLAAAAHLRERARCFERSLLEHVAAWLEAGAPVG